MAKPFKMLREKMPPEARRRAAVKTKVLLEEMTLDELRRARALSQEKIAEELDIKQASVSKLERRTDMYISTLRRFVRAAGGELEILARFDDGVVKIGQFADLEDTPEDIAEDSEAESGRSKTAHRR